jgi:hypothetical protein
LLLLLLLLKSRRYKNADSGKTCGRPDAGIDFSAYALRHLVAANATREGVDLVSAQTNKLGRKSKEAFVYKQTHENSLSACNVSGMG